MHFSVHKAQVNSSNSKRDKLVRRLSNSKRFNSSTLDLDLIIIHLIETKSCNHSQINHFP